MSRIEGIRCDQCGKTEIHKRARETEKPWIQVDGTVMGKSLDKCFGGQWCSLECLFKAFEDLPALYKELSESTPEGTP